MKTGKLILILLGFTAFFFASCTEEETKIEATGITMNVDSLEVEMESTGTLVATLTPEGAEGDITWTSSDPTVAAVNNGVITGLKVGEATIAAASGVFSVTAVVTVTPKQLDPNDLPESLKGSNYFTIQLDESTFEFIKDKVSQDLRPDEENKFLYVWENTYLPGNPTGLNFFGQAEGWVSLVVGSVGWSGAGYFVGTGFGDIDMTDMYNNPDDYVFHLAIKSAEENSKFLFKFKDGESTVGLCIGGSDFVDGSTTYQPFANFPRDNEWHSIEIPVTKLNELGLFYSKSFTNGNVIEILAGGVSGTTLDLDAMFFYKKPAN